MRRLKKACAFLLAREGLQTLAVAASSALFAAVIIYTRITDQAMTLSADNQPLRNNFKADASTTIATVRTLQGVLAAVSSVALVKSLTFLYWILISRPNGARLPSVLALAPSTTVLGSLRLLVMSSSRLSTRMLALFSIVLTALLWLSGLVLFLDTSMVVVYDTAHSYNVTAGVGQFNASLVDRFMDSINISASGYEHKVLPYSYYGAVHNLVANPVFSNVAEPVICRSEACLSYILSGGIYMTAAWQPLGYKEYPMMKVPQLPVMQLDFDNLPSGSNYTDVECDVFGNNSTRIGARLCLSRSAQHPDTIEAGLFVCSDGVANGVCNTRYPTPNLTTTVSFHSRKADIVASRSNSSIMVVSGLTEYHQITLSDEELSKYKEALRWLLDYSATDIPAPSSIIETFWTSQAQLATEHVSYGYLVQHFHSILAFPVWFFNANNFGNVDLLNDEIISTLPPEFYTKAYVVAPHVMMRFSLVMVILFSIFQGLIVAFVWFMLIWAVFVSESLPSISSYPLFDLTFKSETEISARPDELWTADDFEIEKMSMDAKVLRKAI